MIRSISGGLIAPEGTDPAARHALEAACAQAVATPQYQSALKTLDVQGAYAPGAEFKAAVLAEAARNRLVLRDAQLLLK